jgi:hypothetical protein
MSIVLPDPRLEMPELYHPCRQPVGSVQIDWDDPITRGLKSYLMLGNGVHDLVSNHHASVESLIDRGTIYDTISTQGRCMYSVVSSDPKLFYHRLMDKLNDSAGTLLVYGRVFSHTTAVDTQYPFSARENTSGGNGRIYFGVAGFSGTTGRISYSIEDYSATDTGVSFEIDKDVAFGVSWDGSTEYCAYDGQYIHSRSGGVFTTHPGAFSLVGLVNAAGNFGWDGVQYACVLWDRHLSDAELLKFNLAPRHFLIPA